MQATQTQRAGNNRPIEVRLRYGTLEGKGTFHFRPNETRALQTLLQILLLLWIEADVTNLLTGLQVGGVVASRDYRRWYWWYWPNGVAAQPQPIQIKKTVCSHS